MCVCVLVYRGITHRKINIPVVVLYCAVCVCVCWCTEASHTERSTFLSSCYTVQYVCVCVLVYRGITHRKINIPVVVLYCAVCVCVCVGVQRHHTQKDQHSCRRCRLTFCAANELNQHVTCHHCPLRTVVSTGATKRRNFTVHKQYLLRR